MTAATGSEPGGVIAPHTTETLHRAQLVACWLTEGMPRAEIHREARERWGLATRSADRVIAAARAELIAGADQQREQLVALLLSRCDAIYRAAMATGNHGAALGALNTCARLAQL